MEQILDKVLRPEIVWVLIPLGAVVFFGLGSLINALRGVPTGLEDIRAELADLHTRVAELERTQEMAQHSTAVPR